MDRAALIQFMNDNPAANVATVDGDRPHVRGMLIYRADDSGILFHTGTMKDIYRQLSINPNIELCFFNAQSGIQVRVSGIVHEVDDLALKEEIVAKRPFLKNIFARVDDKGFIVYRITDLEACVWTFATNLAPKKFIRL